MVSHKPEPLPVYTLCNAQIPDTPSVSAVHGFVKAHLDPHVYNHVMRAMFYGFILSNKIPEPNVQNRDKEVHAVAAMMHDMAVNPNHEATKSFVSNDRRFEVDSAEVAREFLANLNADPKWTPLRLQLVWDGIALHAMRSIAAYKEPEVMCTSFGVGADFVPPGASVHKPHLGSFISQVEQTAVEEYFPKEGFLQSFKESCCALCATKPATTYDNWVGGFGDVFLDDYTVVGTRLADRIKNELGL